MARDAPLRLAVLDMIGTTVEAGDEVPRAFVEAFRGAGVELPDRAVVEARGRSKSRAIAALVATFLPDSPDPEGVAAEIYATFQERLRAHYAGGAREVPGARAVFERLEGAGVAVVLATGLDRLTTDGVLRALGWDARVGAGAVTGDDVALGRPAPDLIHAAMARAGVSDPASVLTAGDTTVDLAAAAAAGVGWSVGVLTGAHDRARLATCPHTVLVESVADLPRWLEGVGVLPSVPAS